MKILAWLRRFFVRHPPVSQQVDELIGADLLSMPFVSPLGQTIVTRSTPARYKRARLIDLTDEDHAKAISDAWKGAR